MNAVFVLLPLALMVAGAAVALFIWAVRSGQYDDLDTPPVRMLFDDEAPPAKRRPDPAQSPDEPVAVSPGPEVGRSQTP